MDTYMGSTVARCLELIEDRLGRPPPAGFGEHYLETRMRALKRELAPVPGIETALDALAAAGLRTCVASSNSLAVIRDSLDWAGLRGRFGDRLYSAADHVKRSKPHPDVFLFAAEQQGVPPERCVVVEDSPSGAAGGVAAGMLTFGFARDVTAGDLAAVGAVPFDDMSELLRLVTNARDLASNPAEA